MAAVAVALVLLLLGSMISPRAKGWQSDFRVLALWLAFTLLIASLLTWLGRNMP